MAENQISADREELRAIEKITSEKIDEIQNYHELRQTLELTRSDHISMVSPISGDVKQSAAGEPIAFR